MAWFIFSEVMFFCSFLWSFVLCKNIGCSMACRRRF
jgi:heme/copper-type cytochrome/quinol oxidase subunit 3